MITSIVAENITDYISRHIKRHITQENNKQEFQQG